VTLYRDRGVVLRTWKLGEADRIVAILTREHGKVRAVAKGVRKSGSRFGSRLEPTAHLQLQLYSGRGDLDTVTQVETIDRFATLRNDLDQWARACAMLEAVDQSSQDHEPNEAMFDMLVKALGTLESRPSPLVVAGFFLKLLALEGFEPVVDMCVLCGEADEPLTGFSHADGGTLCEACRRGPRLGAPALLLLRQILGGRLGAALNEPASAATDEVDQLATRLLEHHFDRRLRSIGVLGRH
jgi:DNA repair protein RecO (recombination protein O)